MTTYYTSDQHFGHLNIIRFCDRNHDRCWEGERALRKGDPEARERRRAAALERYLAAGFAEIHDRPEPVAVGGQRATLSHFPFEGDSHGEDRFVEYRPVDDGGWVMVHGHVHNSWRQRGRQINVGVDAWGGRPVPAETIAGLLADGPRDLAPLGWP